MKSFLRHGFWELMKKKVWLFSMAIWKMWRLFIFFVHQLKLQRWQKTKKNKNRKIALRERKQNRKDPTTNPGEKFRSQKVRPVVGTSLWQSTACFCLHTKADRGVYYSGGPSVAPVAAMAPVFLAGTDSTRSNAGTGTAAGLRLQMPVLAIRRSREVPDRTRYTLQLTCYISVQLYLH